MESINRQGELMAELQRLSGCQYLSDLHSSIYKEDVLYALRAINIVLYPMEDWIRAYRYITGRCPGYSSRAALVSDLIRHLEEEE